MEEVLAERRSAEAEAQSYFGEGEDDLLAEVPDGSQAAQELLRASPPTAASRLYKFFAAAVISDECPKAIIHGAGGCGKSHFIRAVVSSLRAAGFPVAIAAPTGCAAFLIRGATLHSCLSLPVVNDSYGKAQDAPLPTGALLQNLQTFWCRVKLLVIDEVSMISEEVFRMIDDRLQIYRRRRGCQRHPHPKSHRYSAAAPCAA